MSRKKEAEGNNERWLVSYADFITLLMVLFILLYAGSQVDIRKYKQLANSLSAAFGGGPLKVVDPMINTSGGSDSTENQVPKPISIPGIPMAPLDAVEVTGQLTDMLSSSRLSAEVSVQNNIEGMLISLSEKLLFISGTADLLPDAYPVLDRLVEMVKPISNEIRVIGHTNSLPVVDSRYEDNWDLSMHRALVIVRYLTSQGIDPSRLMAMGVGPTRPLFPDDTIEHQALNSRAEIVIVYQVSKDIIDLSFDQTDTSGGG